MQCSVTEKLLKDSNGPQAYKGRALSPIWEQKKNPSSLSFEQERNQSRDPGKSSYICNAAT